MNFKKYFKLSLKQISQEIKQDALFNLNKTPLFESPIYHEAEFFNNLNDIRTNHPFALERIKDGDFIQNITIDNAIYKLYRSVEDGYIWDFYISGENGHELVSAFLKYKKNNDMMQIGGLWQIEWVIGLVKTLIINYYSKYFTVLESGTVNNNKGKKFYKKLAKEFIQSHKKVMVHMGKQEIPYEIDNSDSYWHNTNNVPSFEKRLRFYF